MLHNIWFCRWHMLWVHLLHFITTKMMAYVFYMETKYHVLCWYHLVVHQELQQLWVIYKGRRHLTSQPHSCKEENQDASVWWNREHCEKHLWINDQMTTNLTLGWLEQHCLIYLSLFDKICRFFNMKIKSASYIVSVWQNTYTHCLLIVYN